MTGNKIHIALIGAGAMGKRWANVISKTSGTSLDLIMDVDVNRAFDLAAIYKNCGATNKIQDIVTNPNISAVVVVVPHTYLSIMALELLKSGKNVLTEKPGAIFPKDILKNLTVAKKKGVSYFVGFNHRFHQGFLKAKKLFNENKIGDVVFIRARYGFGGRVGYEKEWRLSKKISGGGELIDQGVHMIDLALLFMGIPEKVTGFAVDTFWQPGSDDNAFVLLKKQKSVASIHVSLTQWTPLHNFEIYGTTGYLSVEGLGRKYGGTEVVRFGARKEDFTGPIKEKVYKCNPDADLSLKLELKNFINDIKNKKKSYLLAESAYQTLRVVEKIYKSS